MDSKNQKIVFFLRHYNDIDHIVPVIDKWNETYSVPISVIILTHRSYLSDFRIEYLRTKQNITVSYINDVVVDDGRSEDAPQKRSFDKISSFGQTIQSLFVDGMKSIGRQLPTTIPRRVWSRVTYTPSRSLPDGQKVLSSITEPVDDAVIVFDWPTNPEKPVGKFTQEVLTVAKKEEYTTVSLPHGDKPYWNHLRQNPQFDEFIRSDGFPDSINPISFFPSNGIENFDYVVHPNERSAERVLPHLDPAQIRVLGSPRFNEEWISQLTEIVPSPSLSLPSSGDYNFVLFLRNTNYPIFWSEVVRTIRLISEFEEFELIVKYHTRGGQLVQMLEGEHGFDPAEHRNVHLIADEAHSVSLLEWADVALDLGTSIAFEPIVREMPVLSLEFAHANESTISHYIDGSRLNHRDALYDALLKIRADEELYDVTEQDLFLSDILSFDDGVLDKYILFLAKQFTTVPTQR